MYSKDLDTAHLVTQLQMFPELVHTYNEYNPQTSIQRITSVRTLCDVMNSVSRSMFNQVNKLLHIILIIPVTTSKVIFYFEKIRNIYVYVTDQGESTHAS